MQINPTNKGGRKLVPNNKINLNENEKIVDGKLVLTEDFRVQPKINKKLISEGFLTEAKDEKGKMVLKPRIECIHAGRTRNHNIYPAERLKGDYKLRSGVYSFVSPYPKPMLKNHDHYSEPTGRITDAQFVTDSATGKESIIIIPEITDQETIEKVLDGRYLTVSIGASTDSAICNICGTDIIKDGWCGHSRGETYDDVECGWIVGNLYFDECSWVNVPADSDAKVLSAGEPTVMEAYVQIKDKYYNLSSDNSKEVSESEAKMLGLIAENYNNEPEGGTGRMSKPNVETVTLEEHNIVVEAKATLETQLAEKDTLISEKDTTIAKKDTALAEANTALEEATSKLQATETTLQEKDTAITELNAKVSDLETQVQVATESTATVKTDYLKLLAESVIVFKKALGKPLAENDEEVLTEHLSRSEESLKDTLDDLTKEFRLSKTYNQKVANPGGAVDGEKDQTIEGKEDLDSKELTTEEIMKRLFSGRIK